MTYHLNDDQLSPTSHLARLGLPHASCRSIHPRPKTSHDSSNHHLQYTVGSRLDDRPNGDDRASKEDLTGTPEDITGPDGGHRPEKTAQVIDRCHCPLHIRTRVIHRPKKVVSNNDISENALGRSKSVEWGRVNHVTSIT